jgi:NAD(P)-dependent dehydrogenase (short-subunit alcohol dehydrogenase family)
MIDVNLGPALWLSQAVAPHMRQQGSGAMVHVAARPGIEPSGGMAAYSASKAALVHLTRVLEATGAVWAPLGFDLEDSIAGASSLPVGRLYGR